MIANASSAGTDGGSAAAAPAATIDVAEKMNMMFEQLAEMKGDLAAANEKIDALSGENAGMKSDLAAANEKIDALTTENADLETQLGGMKANLTALGDSINTSSNSSTNAIAVANGKIYALSAAIEQSKPNPITEQERVQRLSALQNPSGFSIPDISNRSLGWKARCSGYTASTKTCLDAQIYFPASAGSFCGKEDSNFDAGWWSLGGENGPDNVEGCHLFCAMVTGSGMTSASEYGWMKINTRDYHKARNEQFDVYRRIRGYSPAETYGSVCDMAAPVFGGTGSNGGIALTRTHWAHPEVVHREILQGMEHASHLLIEVSLSSRSSVTTPYVGFQCPCDF